MKKGKLGVNLLLFIHKEIKASKYFHYTYLYITCSHSVIFSLSIAATGIISFFELRSSSEHHLDELSQKEQKLHLTQTH